MDFKDAKQRRAYQLARIEEVERRRNVKPREIKPSAEDLMRKLLPVLRLASKREREAVETALHTACAPFLHRPNTRRTREQLQSVAYSTLRDLVAQGGIPPEIHIGVEVLEEHPKGLRVHLSTELREWLGSV